LKRELKETETQHRQDLRNCPSRQGSRLPLKIRCSSGPRTARPGLWRDHRTCGGTTWVRR